MNIWEFAGWWITRGIIGWVIFVIILMAGMLYYSLNEDRSAAMDAAMDQLQEKENKHKTRSRILDIITTMIWPLGMIRYSVFMIQAVRIADNILSENKPEM